MKRLLFLIFFAGFLGLALYASALSIFDIEFPIPELGNCADKAECKAYCDNPAHGEACLAFAKKYGLADEATVKRAEAAEEGGPGGCKGAQECRAYCEDSSHEDECIDFAVAKGFMTKEDAERIRKPGPGGCRARQCEQYCSDPAHENECFDYAVANGLIPPEEAARIKEFKSKFGETRTGPGGCKSEEDCRNYCNDPEHINECLAFAEDHGFVSKEESARLKKAGLTKGPGGCRGEEECRAYCEEPSHQNECISFAEENGFMTKEEAERAKKFAGKTGPGGCKGNQCRDFCENPDNAESCLEFAAKEGLMPPQELERARKFMKASQGGGPGGCRGAQCRDYCEDSAHRDECFSFAKGQGLLSQEDEKEFEVGLKIQKKMEESGGPGGCRSEEDCRSYCSDPSKVEECVAFGATHGGIPEEQVRMMLKDFQQNRFEAHGDFGPPQDFQRFEQESFGRFQEFNQLEEQFRGQGFPGGPPGGFPGGPGGFPGGPGGGFGGPGGGGAFAGPGGCTSPQECIKYCIEHKEECFGGGPSGGGPGRGGPQGGGFGPPQLRSNLIMQFENKDLPEDFEQKSEEERRSFFHQRFNEEHGFPGQGNFEQFPGRPGQFEGSREFPGGSGEFPGQQPGEQQPGGQQFQQQFPSSGTFGSPPPPTGGTFEQHFLSPSDGTFGSPPPPTETFESQPPPSGGTFSPPPPEGGTIQPPPPPPPSGRAPQKSFFASFLEAFGGLVR